MTITLCSLNRDFLEKAGVNLYMLLFAFQEEIVDTTFEQDGKRYRISSVHFGNNDDIIATSLPEILSEVI
jgi:hypothetical protein